jgi:TonB family protein
VKYQFGRKHKSLSSDEIKSHMDFSSVAKAAKLFAGIKLTSALLKSGISSSAATTVGTISTVAIITTAAIVGPDLLDSKPSFDNQNVNVTKMVERADKEALIKIDTLGEAKDQTLELKPPPAASKDDVPTIDKEVDTKVDIPDDGIIQKEVKEIENSDVLIRAYPLPDLESFLAIINQELKYPKEGVKDSVEGFVRVHFKVDKQGIAKEFKINKSLGEAFDMEAIRVLKAHQDWEPASFNGQAVDSYFTIKIQFNYETLISNEVERGY